VEIGGKINGPDQNRLPGNIHVSFEGLKAILGMISLGKRSFCFVGDACVLYQGSRILVY
jgi:cysteine sulfinate desulfinase/cysteine desulfurase-like protein